MGSRAFNCGPTSQASVEILARGDHGDDVDRTADAGMEVVDVERVDVVDSFCGQLAGLLIPAHLPAPRAMEPIVPELKCIRLASPPAAVSAPSTGSTSSSSSRPLSPACDSTSCGLITRRPWLPTRPRGRAPRRFQLRHRSGGIRLAGDGQAHLQELLRLFRARPSRASAASIRDAWCRVAPSRRIERSNLHRTNLPPFRAIYPDTVPQLPDKALRADVGGYRRARVNARS
jgi:hypothetical protein